MWDPLGPNEYVFRFQDVLELLSIDRQGIRGQYGIIFSEIILPFVKWVNSAHLQDLANVRDNTGNLIAYRLRDHY